MNEHNEFVLDCGTETTKAGFAEQDNFIPEVLPTKIDHCGRVVYPVQDSMIADWDHMKEFWKTCYEEFEIDSRERPVLITEPPHASSKYRSKMLEIFFGEFEVPAFKIKKQADLAILANGLEQGLVFESGHGSTYLTLVLQGKSLFWGTLRYDICGKDLDEYMKNLLQEEYPSKFDAIADLETVRKIKEMYTYVCDDYEDEIYDLKHCKKQNYYTLPDNEIIEFSGPQFHCPEIFFKPKLIGKYIHPMHKAICNLINKAETSLRKTFYENIILSGGSCCIQNLPNRQLYEMNQIVPANINPRVVACSNTKFNTWIGGVVYSRIHKQGFITKEDYEEQGEEQILAKYLIKI